MLGIEYQGCSFKLLILVTLTISVKHIYHYYYTYLHIKELKCRKGKLTSKIPQPLVVEPKLIGGNLTFKHDTIMPLT